MFSPKRRGRHTRSGTLYHALVAGTCLTALLFAIPAWSHYAFLGCIAVATYISALIGHLAARRKWNGWLSWHIIAQLSSYISMVTAFAVVNRVFLYKHLGLPPMWTWFLPTIIGTPLIMLAVSRATRKRTKKREA